MGATASMAQGGSSVRAMCHACNRSFNRPDEVEDVLECPFCGSDFVEELGTEGPNSALVAPDVLVEAANSGEGLTMHDLVYNIARMRLSDLEQQAETLRVSYLVRGVSRHAVENGDPRGRTERWRGGSVAAITV